MKRAAVAFAACVLLASPAFAQNEVLTHYRAYEAALQRNDLPAAEAAGAEALAASEARDGDGGSTAVLALNLATVRLLIGQSDAALAPAQRALGLAETRGEASRVSPILARLVLGRVEIAQGQDAGATRVLAALEDAQAAHLPASEIYDGAVQLGHFLFTRQDFVRARHAWSIAANYAEGSCFPDAYALARARVGAAASIVLEDLTRGRRGARISRETAIQARSEFNEAVELLRPLAEVESRTGEMTLAQFGYAEALAWRAVLRAKIRSDSLRLPDEGGEAQGDGANEIDVPTTMAAPRCLVRFEYTRNLSQLFPARALDDGALAGLAVRFRVSEAGEVVSAETVAIVGREDFARSVENSSRHWRVERLEDSPPGCRMAMTVITSISFSVR